MYGFPSQSSEISWQMAVRSLKQLCSFGKILTTRDRRFSSSFNRSTMLLISFFYDVLLVNYKLPMHPLCSPQAIEQQILFFCFRRKFCNGFNLSIAHSFDGAANKSCNNLMASFLSRAESLLIKLRIKCT